MNILGSSTHPQDHDGDLLHIRKIMTEYDTSIAMSASQTQASEIVHARMGILPNAPQFFQILSVA